MPYIRVNGLNLYYETSGQGRPVLFLHGLGSSVRDWERQIPVFAAHYRTIAFDQRGHGKSEKPQGPYGIPLFAADAAALVEKLDLGPVHLVGVSLGGMVGLQMALDAPELVRSLTAINCTAMMMPRRTLGDRWQLWQRLLIVRLLGMRKMGEVLAKRLFIRDDQEDLRQLFIGRWAENNPSAYCDAMKGMFGWTIENRLGEIKCPVLVVAADEDYTPVKAKEDLVARLPRAELAVIRDSRHGTPMERPEELNGVVLEFLSKLV